MSIILTIQFPENFDRRYKKYKTKLLGIQKTTEKEKSEPDILSIQLKSGSLTLNKDTGFVRLNNFETNINPNSQEFRMLLKLMSDKNHQATYGDLLGENVSKANKRNLTFVIRNIKTSLGILPSKKAKNKDIIRNIKGYGYRLIT